MKNFYPKQYEEDLKKTISHSYLIEQFSDYKKIFKRIEKVIRKGDYTLGNEVDQFEKNISKITSAKYVIGVGNGTDALYLTLKCLGIGYGDEVITTPYTFIATVGSIVTAGATPVFVDIKNDYNIDEDKIEKAITKKTKAIMPVHWAGRPCELSKLSKIARKHKLRIIQDSCHAIMSKFNDKDIISYGDVCTFSMHPLKNLNVWGDGGFIITNSKNKGAGVSTKILSRLDTIQAAIANYKIKNKLKNITNKRISNALYLDKLLSKNKNIITVKRKKNLKEVFHLYHINTRKRDKLLKHLIKNKIDAKIHYPVPIHLQPAAKYLNYSKGDFPNAEKLANTSISLPVHEFVSKIQLKKMAKLINKFKF